MNYTKGPWTTCCGKCWTVSSTHHPIAQVEHGEWGDSFPTLEVSGPSMLMTARAVIERIPYGKIDEEIAMNNMRLIAAAPDMYEALKAVIPDLEDIIKDIGECDHSVGICLCGQKSNLEVARAALNKAEDK